MYNVFHNTSTYPTLNKWEWSFRQHDLIPIRRFFPCVDENNRFYLSWTSVFTHKLQIICVWIYTKSHSVLILAYTVYNLIFSIMYFFLKMLAICHHVWANSELDRYNETRCFCLHIHSAPENVQLGECRRDCIFQNL